MLRKLGRDTDTTYESLRRDAENIASGKVAEAEKSVEIRESKDGIAEAERFALCAALLEKQYAQTFNFRGYDFSDPVRNKLADIISESRENGKRVFPSTVATLFGENELVEYNAVLSSGDNVFGSDGETRYFSDCVSKMMKNKLETELAQLNEVFRAETDTEKRKEIVGAIAKITAKLAKY